MDQETLKHFELKSTEELKELVEKHNTQIYKEEAFEIMRYILEERNKESTRYRPGFVEDVKNEENKDPDIEVKDKEIDGIPELTPPPIPQNEFNANVESNEPKNTNEESFKSGNESESHTKQKQKMFLNPFSFQDRIRRTEYGISLIIYFVIIITINVMLEAGSTIWLLFYIPMTWFLWAQGAKRCHDMGQSGWFQIIPFYVIWMIFAKGESGAANQYGSNPKK